MIATFMAWSTAAAALFGVAALAFEHAATQRRLSLRVIWTTALALSVTLPLLNAVVPHRSSVPPILAPPLALLNPPAQAGGSARVSGSPAVMRSTATREPEQGQYQAMLVFVRSDRVLSGLWLFGSSGLLALYCVASMQLWAAARRWRLQVVSDQEVWISENMGPAVLGFWRPRILIPRWALESTISTRNVILTHEQEHVRAGDPWLVLVGLLVIAAMPWNLALWWQVRRLRFAIEVDCDARVLARGTDPRSYGEVLLSIMQRQSSTPIVAIALNEPASQLLRRIRIMARSYRKRGPWLAGGVLGAALTCAAVATQLQAPVIPGPTPTPIPAGGLPLKPPPGGQDPWAERALAAARVQFPELTSGPILDGQVFVTIALNANGTVFKAAKNIATPDNWSFASTDQQSFDRVGVYTEQLQSSGIIAQQKSAASPNGYCVTYAVLKPDPALTHLRLLRKIVFDRFAQSFRTITENGPRANILTVFLTEAGDIEKARVEGPIKGANAQSLKSPDRFGALGIDRNRLGVIGDVFLTSSEDTASGSYRGLLVIYAWPRRAGETGPTILQEGTPGPVGDDPAVDLAIVEHYFPDAFKAPESAAHPWVLLNRAGEVLRTGRFSFNSSNVLSGYLEALLPGAKIRDYFGTSVVNAKGEETNASFLWLAPDSPTTDLTRLDLTRQRDVFLSVNLTTQNSSFPLAIPMALTFGVPATTDAGEPVQLQVVATDAAAGYVDLEVQLHAPKATGAQTVDIRSHFADNDTTSRVARTADEAGSWAPDGPKVRVDYGKEATVIFRDEQQRSWTVVLRPERLRPRAI